MVIQDSAIRATGALNRAETEANELRRARAVLRRLRAEIVESVGGGMEAQQPEALGEWLDAHASLSSVAIAQRVS